jgi:hypothetical protein
VPSEESVLEFLAALHRSASMVDRRWRSFFGGETHPVAAEAVRVSLHLQEADATPAALTVYDVDRELRRAVTILRSEFRAETPYRTVATTFRPLPVRDGGLSIERAEAGSLDLFFAVSGAVAQALLSDPIQLTLTLRELLAWTGHILVTLGRVSGQPVKPQLVHGSEGIQIETGPDGLRVSGVPEGVSLVVDHTARDGSETHIEIARD